MTCIHSPIPTDFSPSYLHPIPDDNEALGDEITRLAGHINAAEYRFLTLLAVLVERKAWDGDSGIKSPAHWLNYRCGISLGPAREKVRVALALKSLPLIDEAFSKGGISYSKVRAMTRAATPDNEDYLLMIARHGTASHVEKLVRQFHHVKRLSSDASLVTVLDDGSGNVLNVGRKSRTVPPAIRRALALRDRGCRFPGCCESKYVDAHHIHHWCDGGETRLDNLVLLCRRHHRLLHEKNYGIEMDKTGNPVFFNPGGREIQSAIYPQFPEGNTKNVSAETFLAIEQQHEELGLAIDPKTAVSAWLGEKMDYGIAVESLLRKDERQVRL